MRSSSALNDLLNRFVEERKSSLGEFIYQDFADLMAFRDRETVDLYYWKVLEKLYVSPLTEECRAKMDMFLAREDKCSEFGKEYTKYWTNRNYFEEKMKEQKMIVDKMDPTKNRALKKFLAAFAADYESS